jgi:CDP-diacylglycerol--serine O-phosphatidyltransferase
MKIFKEICFADLFSLLNSLSGFLGLYYLVTYGLKDMVFYFVLFSALMDGIDGFTAKKFGSSKMGKELDSLADLVSFGLLPSMVLVKLGFIYSAIPFFLATILRLARFNVLKLENFLGLPTTASALLVMCLINLNVPFVQYIALALSVLMISDVEYVKVKDKRILAFVGVVVLLCFVSRYAVALLTVLVLAYIFSPIVKHKSWT